MKLLAGLLTALAAGMTTHLRLRARAAAGQSTDFLNIFLTVLVFAGSLFVVSLFLPDDLALLAQQFIGWCLAGTVAVIALLASVKVLEGLLDS